MTRSARKSVLQKAQTTVLQTEAGMLIYLPFGTMYSKIAVNCAPRWLVIGPTPPGLGPRPRRASPRRVQGPRACASAGTRPCPHTPAPALVRTRRHPPRSQTPPLRNACPQAPPGMESPPRFNRGRPCDARWAGGALAGGRAPGPQGAVAGLLGLVLPHAALEGAPRTRGRGGGGGMAFFLAPFLCIRGSPILVWAENGRVRG
jgi:hypothetical protein